MAGSSEFTVDTHPSFSCAGAATEAPFDALYLIDSDDPSTDATYRRSAAELLGYSQTEIAAMHAELPLVLIHSEDRARFDKFQESARSGSGNISTEECRMRRPDGEWHRIQFHETVLAYREDGTPRQTMGYLCDVTETRRSEERLRLLESVVVNANDVILITDAEPLDMPHGPRVVYVNDAFTRMTGYAPDEILGRTPRVLQGPDTDRETCRFIREKLVAWQGFQAELLNYKKDGTPFWVELNVQPVADVKGWYTHWIAIQRDITQRKKLEAEQERLLADALNRIEHERLLAEALDRADRDPLTNLLNHRAFHERLAREADAATAQGTPLMVAMLDLDNFKFFNDAYGHLTGDAVLRQVADALLAACQPSDTLARLGGDEFALIAPGRDREAATRLMEQLRQSVHAIGYSPPGYEMEIPFSVSSGFALCGEDGVSFLSVLEAADERLLRDKIGDQDYETEQLRDDLKTRRDGFAMLDALVTAVDNKDRYTRRHSEDVMRHSVAMARHLALPDEDIRALQVAALLHDVGKIGVPDRILRMPGRLTDSEYDAIKQHAEMGAIIVGAMPGLEDTLLTIRHHHERWDGKGYPGGLVGEAIPLTARILAVADAVSAMTTNRPYRRGLTWTATEATLRGGAGTQWDARCVEALLGTHAQEVEPRVQEEVIR